MMSKSPIFLYRGVSYKCSYLPEQTARMHIVDPGSKISPDVYSRLLKNGFRRSGDMVYRPGCYECNSCVAVRLNPENFKPNRSQRRCLKSNEDLTLSFRPCSLTEEHYQLYQDYLFKRHGDSEMAMEGFDSMVRFFNCTWGDVWLLEARLNERLVLVAVVDKVKNGLSALYTFFDDNLAKRSLGIFAVLKQLELCHKLDLNYLYLGYWVDGCRKMQYKKLFSPIEMRQADGQWLSVK